jgi:purine-nucleoside phosphorylase
MPPVETLKLAASFVSQRFEAPALGVVLGSGLGAFAEQLTDSTRLRYADIPGMPGAAVAGHAGELVHGTLGTTRVACLSGRAHAYEGYPVDQVVFGVRLLAQLGCRAVLLTNAAGGLGQGFAAGDLMLITDHLNLTGKNPLAVPSGELPEGPRFVDMTRAYDPRLLACARAAAKQLGLQLREGVYAGMLGPNYETPAEIRMLGTLGASAVGMSTVLEVIALRQLGVPVAAISCITNLAAGISPTILSHDEVQHTALLARDRFIRLLSAWIEQWVQSES